MPCVAQARAIRGKGSCHAWHKLMRYVTLETAKRPYGHLSLRPLISPSLLWNLILIIGVSAQNSGSCARILANYNRKRRLLREKTYICNQKQAKLHIPMTGSHLLVAGVIIVFVIAFIATMLVLNASAKKIISTNTKLVENQNTLLEQNKIQGRELEKRMSELKEKKGELEVQKEMIEALQRQQEELAERLKHAKMDEVTLLREQTRQHREYIELTADMTDEELMAWLDQKMDETRLFTDTNLTLKTMAKSLGLTQKRLGGLFKNHPKYSSLGDYLNEKRFLLACKLLVEEPNWTIEAVGAEAGFGGRRTFQTEVKRRLGITPLQYRQSQALSGEE